jgi:uncharacterized lipoprotein
MKQVMIATAALALLAACSANSDRANSPYSPPLRSQNAQTPPLPFNNGLRTDRAQPTNCSPADNTCGTGIGNPSIQSPIQKREQGVTPGGP